MTGLYLVEQFSQAKRPHDRQTLILPQVEQVLQPRDTMRIALLHQKTIFKTMGERHPQTTRENRRKSEKQPYPQKGFADLMAADANRRQEGWERLLRLLQLQDPCASLRRSASKARVLRFQ